MKKDGSKSLARHISDTECIDQKTILKSCPKKLRDLVVKLADKHKSAEIKNLPQTIFNETLKLLKKNNAATASEITRHVLNVILLISSDESLSNANRTIDAVKKVKRSRNELYSKVFDVWNSTGLGASSK